MTKEEMEFIIEQSGHENVVTFEEPAFNNAFLGLTTDGRAVYSYTLMMRGLIDENEEWAEEDAEEWIQYNVIPAAAQIPAGPIILDIEMIDSMTALVMEASMDFDEPVVEHDDEVVDEDPEEVGRA